MKLVLDTSWAKTQITFGHDGPLLVAIVTATRHSASASSGVVLVHPERGELSRSDVVASNVHDAIHHQWEIGRTFQA